MSREHDLVVEQDPTTAEETIARLCKLLDTVHEARGGGYADGPCDCICPSRPSKHWRSTGEALRFVEYAVRLHLRFSEIERARAETTRLEERIKTLQNEVDSMWGKGP